MRRLIFRNKNKIVVLNGALVVAAFLLLLLPKGADISEWVMLSASVIGLLPIAIQAVEALRVKVVSIDALVTTAVVAAYFIGNFEEAAIVTFLFLLGDYLEDRTLGKTRAAIRELTQMAPESALKQTENGGFEEVLIDEVEIGDVLLVKTGAKIPVDGTVLSGEGSVNEASITGESFPAQKEKGDSVFAGTILDNGTLQIVAERVGEDTTFGRIIELVEEAQDSKSKAERFLDRFSKYYTPAVLAFALLVWIFTKNTEMAITILVLGCPGALVIGVPVSNVAGIGNGAKAGVLLKGSEVIHDLGRLNTMVFDKTGTLTEGNPSVAEALYYGDNREEALSCLASVEKESDHPLAKAVLEAVGDAPLFPVQNTRVIKGEGIVANVNGHSVAVGNAALMETESIPLSETMRTHIARLEENGNSLVITAVDGKVKIIMGVRDKVRRGVGENLKKLKRLGIKNLILLSGDNQRAVDAVSRELSLTRAHGNMLPEDKSAYIKRLMDEGKTVAFVGDGVNDSPSLALANIGIAMGSGTDVAIETSDVVLMNSDFARLPHAVGLAKAIVRNIRQNVVIALGVVLALLYGVLFTGWVSMSVGMLVHVASELAVILNAARLLNYRLK